MPPAQTIQNNFKAGLKTEFTGLNFPEDAATDTLNCVFSYIGDTTRRGGINYEANFVNNPIGVSGVSYSSFRWLNAGGDGESQILVQQIGAVLYFFLSSNATIISPLSSTLLPTNVNLTNFLAQGSNITVQQLSNSECQYAAGNGYLFVFHPNCDPFYVVYTPVTQSLTATVITVSIRDFVGVPDGLSTTFRPPTLSAEHEYNLINQGWGQTATSATTTWSGSGTFEGNIPSSGSQTFSISSQANTTAVTVGSIIQVILPTAAGTGTNPHVNGSVTLIGTVTAYNTSTVTITIGSNSNPALNITGMWADGNFNEVQSATQMSLVSAGFIATWQSQVGNYPSNSDIWWLYKNTSDVFQPSATLGNVQQNTGPAPKGSVILKAFAQQRGSITGLPITDITTFKRPSTGAFYAGRVFYAGVNDSQQATGDEPYTTWTENIYFSQIITSPTNFGQCYQTNDPTDQNFFDLLASDGGVVSIQGCGAVYKLFALRFGVLVFAANGVWFISGSTGIGFTATDFTVTKISSIQTIAGTSFVDVQGYPFFWNQEGIYQVVPSAQPGSAHSPDIQLDVQNIALGTILTFYNDIPTISKLYTRGDYDVVNFIIQWVYKTTSETSISDRYDYDGVLSYNTITKAFYPYEVSTVFLPEEPNAPVIKDVKYLQNPGGSNSPGPILKYLTSTPSTNLITFSEENDFTNYVDFISSNGKGYGYTSYFISGYNLPGQALRKIQTPYVYLFSRNPIDSSLSVQAIWDYAGGSIGSTDANSGKWSTRQTIYFNQTDYAFAYRKVRLRGRGMAVQIRISSIAGQPFDLMGWSVLDQVNQVV